MKNRIQQYINIESFSGILLFIGMVFALILSNSTLYQEYLSLINLPISITIGDFSLNKPFIKWTNDGLMAAFFLVITLEAKFHFLEGEFTSKDNYLLPIIAAIGGVIVPALFYFSITQDDPISSKGWAIPIATDTAFVLGILSFFSNKIPFSVRIIVVALSIIDDIIAVVILAVFYTPAISYFPLLIATVILLLLTIINLLHISKLSLYIILGLGLWLSLIESGVHGTIAGVLLGLFIPQRVRDSEEKVLSPLKRLEHFLHPLVALIILPIFSFLNCEIPFHELTTHDFYSSITVGILGGLVLGKQIGIISFSFLAIKLRICKLSHGLTWNIYYAISILCGIGFTFSLFIGGLSFENDPYLNQMKLGVILGSLLSALVGTVLLYRVTRVPNPPLKEISSL